VRKRPRQQQLREECDTTMQYIDQAIEKARRLSRDLSPSILEDLGFSAAVKRLVEEFSAACGVSRCGWT
jgi:two-component system, NarL family, sensor kinase